MLPSRSTPAATSPLDLHQPQTDQPRVSKLDLNQLHLPKPAEILLETSHVVLHHFGPVSVIAHRGLAIIG